MQDILWSNQWLYSEFLFKNMSWIYLMLLQWIIS
jgi:hypothetical protein